MALALWLLYQLRRAQVPIPARSPILVTLLAGSVVIVLAGLLARIAPTRRALRINPTEALQLAD